MSTPLLTLPALTPASRAPRREGLARRVLSLAWVGAAVLLALPAQADDHPPSTNVAWKAAASDTDIERLFAQGKADRKPLLIYWGAVWCPPCNQLKATLFNRQDFAERAKSFVAVHIDGDSPGAQKLGARFRVRGYPTLLLFNADGQEITRLPGEVEAPRVMDLLQLGLAGGRSVKAVLAEARAGKAVSANEWRMLAFYGWDTDESQLVTPAERPGLLAQLAAACPPSQPELAARFWLRALAESDEGKGIKPDDALRARVSAWLADPASSRAQMDVLVSSGSGIVAALAPEAGADREALRSAMDASLRRIQADTSLSRGDRLSALTARVSLARLGQARNTAQPKVPAPLLAEVKQRAAELDKEITDAYERQAVVTEAGSLLALAGLWKESDALLKANLPKSHSPYYLMSELASNARKQGHAVEALAWYKQAFEKSVGPATRLQWGAAYLGALIDLSPKDVATIEALAAALFREASSQEAAFYERSGRALKNIGTKLGSWSDKGQHRDTLERLRAQLTPVCTKLPDADGQKAACSALIKA